MLLSCWRPALFVVLAALMLAASLVWVPAAAAASASQAGTVTTQLRPGWNMVAWIGPPASVSELFDAVPALEHIYAWNNKQQRYQRALPTSTPLHGLRHLTTGMGLWLLIGGDSPIKWTHSLSEDYALLSLRAGRNLVGWTGRDGERFEEAAARFGDTLVKAERWNATTQRYEWYRPDVPGWANTLRELNRGDALWVELTGDIRWWQSGTARTTFEFASELSAEQRTEIRGDMARVLAFFAERYGIEPPQFSVAVVPDLGVYANANGQRITLSMTAAKDPEVGRTLAHEYFHVLQGPRGRIGPPAWMTEGAATYAAGLYQREQWRVTGETLRWEWWLGSRTFTKPLSEIERIRLFYVDGWPEYSLGALAMEWLEGHAAGSGSGEVAFTPQELGWPDSFTDEGMYIRFYQMLSSSVTWQEAFEEAFSITVDDFYETFEQYRDALEVTYATPSTGSASA